jgi:hypothetical protein
MQIAFRVNADERRALDELCRRRGVKTGDASLSGYFRELIRRDAARAGVAMGEAAPGD